MPDRLVKRGWLINLVKRSIKNYIYLNFEQNSDLKALFSGNLIPDELIENIGLYLGKKIEAKNTLIFFDEIQAVPEAITSLKYFYEQAPEYHLISAGSLLGVQVGKVSSFPVGKVNFLTLYPMSFIEYLNAIREEPLLDHLNKMQSADPLPNILHEKLISHLKRYLYLGGMPEVVKAYIENKNIAEVRAIQNEILQAYQMDFSKYTDALQAIKTAELWQSIPYQLAKESKKFKYSDVRKKARASTFEQTIEWLKNAGLIHLAYNIKTIKLPLAGYADYSKFKIYMHDTGLLGAMLNLSSDVIVRPNALFTEYNGAFIENFVANEFAKLELINDLFYWTSRSDAEVDFVIQLDNEVFPVEVKSGLNRNIKSLRSYADKYQPKKLCRISPRNFTEDHDFINIPLYAAFVALNILTEIKIAK